MVLTLHSDVFQTFSDRFSTFSASFFHIFVPNFADEGHIEKEAYLNIISTYEKTSLFISDAFQPLSPLGKWCAGTNSDATCKRFCVGHREQSDHWGQCYGQRNQRGNDFKHGR